MSKPIPACGNTRRVCPGPPDTFPQHPSDIDNYWTDLDHAINCGTCQAAMLNCARTGCRRAVWAFAPWLERCSMGMVRGRIRDPNHWDYAQQQCLATALRGIQGEIGSLSPQESLIRPDHVPAYATTTFQNEINRYLRRHLRPHGPPPPPPPDPDGQDVGDLVAGQAAAATLRAALTQTLRQVDLYVRDFVGQIEAPPGSRFSQHVRQTFFRLWWTGVKNQDPPTSRERCRLLLEETGVEINQRTSVRWLNEMVDALRPGLRHEIDSATQHIDEPERSYYRTALVALFERAFAGDRQILETLPEWGLLDDESDDNV